MGGTTEKTHYKGKGIVSGMAIINNEDITVYYLVKRHSNRNIPNKVEARELTLFASHNK